MGATCSTRLSSLNTSSSTARNNHSTTTATSTATSTSSPRSSSSSLRRSARRSNRNNNRNNRWALRDGRWALRTNNDNNSNSNSNTTTPSPFRTNNNNQNGPIFFTLSSSNNHNNNQGSTTPSILRRRPSPTATDTTNDTTTNTTTTTTPQTDQAEVERLQQELALMEAFFQSFLNNNSAAANPFFQAAAAGGQLPNLDTVNLDTVNHATAKRVLRQIPTVKVTADDLVDENNRECCICLEEIHLGGLVSRLPCGHVFHRACITDWLEKHNTCCICRYEMETDDPAYERVRLQKMKHRKPRFRDHELRRMPMPELKRLCHKLRVDPPPACFERQSWIDSLKNSGKIDLIAAPPPLEYKVSQLRRMGVGDLKKVLNQAGVFFDPVNVLEKEDLVQIFINSGRLNPLPEEEHDEEEDELKVPHKKNYAEVENESRKLPPSSDYNTIHVLDDSDQEDDDDDEVQVMDDDFDQVCATSVPSTTQSSSYSAYAYTSTRSSSSLPSSTQPSLAARTISELKSFARELEIDIHDCVEKRDIVERIANVFKDNDDDDVGEPATSRRRF